MEDHLPATDAAVWTYGAREVGILIFRQEILGAPAHRLRTRSIPSGAKLANDRPTVKQTFHHAELACPLSRLGSVEPVQQDQDIETRLKASIELITGVGSTAGAGCSRRWRPVAASFSRMIVQIAAMPAAKRRA